MGDERVEVQVLEWEKHERMIRPCRYFPFFSQSAHQSLLCKTEGGD